MHQAETSWTVALDGGTTNTRARLLRGDALVATARRAAGARDEVLSPRSHALARAVGDVISEVCQSADVARPDRIVAAGMLTSEAGLACVNHVTAPAGLDELAAAVSVRTLPEISPTPIAFIPGVRSPAASGDDGWAAADVMRGEECETLGAWILLAGTDEPSGSKDGATIFVWPGSHTKVVEVDAQGRITRSHTTLAGELAQAVGRHTLIAASLPEEWPAELDPPAVATGARLAERDGLGRAAFLVRIAGLDGRFDATGRASFWIGAVVADDVRRISGQPILPAGANVWVGGTEPLRSLYASRLAETHRGPVRALSAEMAERASGVGALAIARRFEEIGRR